jgi:putative membrane protein insertion efficiency factor
LKELNSILKFVVLIPVRLYQGMISPFFPGSCRHEPTCSAYMFDAVKEWGALRGFWMGLKRLSSCGPWSSSFGPDPVPKKIDKNIP